MTIVHQGGCRCPPGGQRRPRRQRQSSHPNEQALIYSGLGDKDRTFEPLERMAVLGAQRVGQYLNLPELALVRDDPRLITFRRKVGLPDR